MLSSLPASSLELLRVTHQTHYVYAQPVSQAHHMAMLKPISDDRQQLLDYAWKVEAPAYPTPVGISPISTPERRARDRFQNTVCWFSLYHLHQNLTVETISKVALAPKAWPAAQNTVNCALASQALRYRASQPWTLPQAFVSASDYVPLWLEIKAWAAQSVHAQKPVLAAAIELMERIYADFRYRSLSTSIQTPLGQVFTQREGVCQDFAHILIAAMRAHGLAARYVSGYLLTQPAPGQARLIGADASHAWVQVWCPLLDGGGLWVDLDPTNNLLPSQAHVRLAVGRDFGDVTPIKGVIRGGGNHTVQVAVTVELWHDSSGLE